MALLRSVIRWLGSFDEASILGVRPPGEDIGQENHPTHPSRPPHGVRFADLWRLIVLAALGPVFLFPGQLPWPLLLLLPVIWIGPIASRRNVLPVTELNSALALMALMVLVSTWATYDLSFSLPKVAGVVYGMALFFELTRVLRTFHRPDMPLSAFAALGAAVALLGLLGTNWISKMPFLGPLVSRLPAVIRGVPGQAEGFQPNAIGGTLILFVPLQAALTAGAFAERRNRRPLLLVVHATLFLFTLAVLVLTQSRGAWIGLAIGLAAALLWGGRRARLFLAFLIIAVIVGVAVIGPSMVAERAAYHVGAGMKSNVGSRTELWSRAIYGIQDFPFTGMGMNTFRRVMPVLYPAFLTGPDVDVAHAHNHLLQTALDLGVPGLIAYVAIWMGAFAMLARAIGRSRGPERWLPLGLASGLIAYFVFGTADAIALGAKLGIFFWIALALAVSFDTRGGTCAAGLFTGDSETDRRRRSLRREIPATEEAAE